MRRLRDFDKNVPVIDRFIQMEALKLAERHDGYHNYLQQEHERKKRRFLSVSPKKIRCPLCWDENKKFNPYYVLKHHKQIYKSIRKKIDNGTYKPYQVYQQQIPKGNGAFRVVNVYQIPDAAVSNYLYYKLLSKNKHRFSYYAYAYRDDKNVHYAIQDIALELKSHARLFVAEYDFSDFFGSISHDYLFEQMNQNGFVITHKERLLIKSFLPESGIGIPQGTSVSLFLANLVCWQLDRQLELEGLKFARYADDTIIWSEDYNKICNAFKIISMFSKNSSVKINYNKSSGISLLATEDILSEFKNTKEYIEFLGYKLSCNSISIKERSCTRIKNNISYILYQNLIQPLANGLMNANPVCLPNRKYDPAFLVAISQIRRYLYGDLTDEKIIKYLNNSYKKLEFKGLMSFYPLVDDEIQLKQLDGWLVHTIMYFLKKRYNILRSYKKTIPTIPLRVKADFTNYCNNEMVNGKKELLKIPSFVRIYKAVKKGVSTQGIMAIVNPQNNEYEYEA